MIAKRLLSETEEEYETSEGRRITIGVPSNCKNTIDKPRLFLLLSDC